MNEWLVSYVTLDYSFLYHILEQSSLGKRSVPGTGKYDVIVNRYSDDLAAFDKLACDGQILLTWFRAVRRVVVGDYDRCSCCYDCAPENFPWVDKA